MNDLDEVRELKPLLAQWAVVEPLWCRQKDADHFELLYAGQWLSVTDHLPSHGTIIAAVLEACQRNRIYCRIEYIPRYEDEPAEVRVGCIYRAFRYQEGDNVINTIPALLLLEYLERLRAKDE